MRRTGVERGLLLIGLAWLLVACKPHGVGPTATPAIPAQPPSPSPQPTDAPEPTPGEPPTPTPGLPTPVADPVRRLTAGAGITIHFIQMQDAATGWAVARSVDGLDHVLRTADGGVTWADVSPPEYAGSPESPRRATLAASADGQHAWVVYSGAMDLDRNPVTSVVWRTSDAGDSWQPSRVIEAPGGSGWFEPVALGFLDDGFGWLMAAIDAGMNHQYVAVYTTADHGASWLRVVDPYGDQPVQSCPKTGLVFADDQTGWMTRDCAGLMDQVAVIITTDGGRTWAETPLPAIPALPGGFSYPNLCTPHAIRLDSPSAGSLVVSCRRFLETPTADGEWMQEGPHALFRTTDGGATWRLADLPGGSLYWLDSQRGWSLGRTLYWTQDGGGIWTRLHEVNWDGQFSFVDEMNGWAVATNEDETALVRTTSGGTKWSILLPVIGP